MSNREIRIWEYASRHSPRDLAIMLVNAEDALRELRELQTRARNLPEPTPREKEEQALDFAYGNLACSTNHRPVRGAFLSIALARGWTVEEFEKWSEGKEWR